MREVVRDSWRRFSATLVLMLFYSGYNYAALGTSEFRAYFFLVDEDYAATILRSSKTDGTVHDDTHKRP